MAKRGKIPSLISGSSGKPTLETTINKRSCTRCSCDILGGQKYFGIPKLGSGFSNKKPFCKNCFKEILDESIKDLQALQKIWNDNL